MTAVHQYRVDKYFKEAQFAVTLTFFSCIAGNFYRLDKKNYRTFEIFTSFVDEGARLKKTTLLLLFQINENLQDKTAIRSTEKRLNCYLMKYSVILSTFQTFKSTILSFMIVSNT